MADEKENQTEGAPAPEPTEETPPKKKGLPMKLILIVVGVLVLIGVGAGAYFFFFSKKDTPTEQGEAGAAPADGEHKALTPDLVTYYDFPELLINLKAEQGNGGRFLKALFVLELEKKEDEEKIKNQTPRITDMFQVYLRELRINDIEGAGGMDRVRDELLTRLNQILQPVRVHNILFKQFLIQ
jgi:flagellar FliL protein